MTLYNRLKLRKGTASQWSTVNPTLEQGEPGVDLTNNRLKVGDGSTAWNNLNPIGGTTNASDLTSGTLNDARLSANVVLTSDLEDYANDNWTSALPATLHNVQLSNLSTTPSPIEYIDDKLWGVNLTTGQISTSTNFGQSWSTIRNTSYASISRIIKCDDGEILIVTTSAGYKSSGWASNPATATFTQKFTVTGTGANILAWGVDASDDGSKIIVGEYAGGGYWANSRKVWISTDGGDTFDVVYDALARYGTVANENTHIHAVCYDQWLDRYWVSEGHSAPNGVGGLYYSDDAGVTWTHLTDASIHEDGAYTVLVATKHGLVCGTDNAENGVMVISKPDTVAAAKAVMAARWINEASAPGLAGFAIRGYRDKQTGLVYIGFQCAFNVKVPMFVSDGKSAKLIYTIADTGAIGDQLFSQVVHNNKLIGHYKNGGNLVDRLITAEIGGSAEVADIDSGNVLGGTTKQASTVVVGKNSTAVSAAACTVVGQSNTVSGSIDSSIVVGFNNTVNGYRVLLIGNTIDATGAGDSIYIGRSITANGTFQMAIGSGLTLNNTGLVAIGTTVNASGSNSCGVGANVDARGAEVTAFGTNVKAADGSNVAVSQCYVSGYNCRTYGAQSTAIGHTSNANLWSSAVGYNAQATDYSSAFGHGANAGYGTGGAYYCTAIGDRAIVTAALAAAIGEDTQSSHSGAVVIGATLRSTGTNQIRFGAKHLEIDEISDPAAPDANRGRLFVRDNGSGKTQLCIRFPTGAIQIIATEP